DRLERQLRERGGDVGRMQIEGQAGRLPFRPRKPAAAARDGERRAAALERLEPQPERIGADVCAKRAEAARAESELIGGQVETEQPARVGAARRARTDARVRVSALVSPSRNEVKALEVGDDRGPSAKIARDGDRACDRSAVDVDAPLVLHAVDGQASGADLLAERREVADIEIRFGEKLAEPGFGEARA